MDIAAEQGLLGCTLLDPGVAIEAASRFTRSDFCEARHRTYFTAIAEMVGAGTPVDLVRLTDHLRRTDRLADGDAPYIASLLNATPTALHFDFFGDLIREAALRRRLNTLGLHLQSGSTNGHSPLEAAERARAELEEILSGHRDGAAPHGLALAEWHTADQWAVTSGIVATPLVEGLIYPGVVHVLAGPTGIGKTFLALQLAASLARGESFLCWHARAPRPVLYVNLELPAWELSNRLRTLGAPASLIVGNLRGLDVLTGGHSTYIEAQARMAQAGLIVIDTVARCHRADEQDATSTQQVMATFEAWAARLGVGVVLVHHTRKQAKAEKSWRLTVDDVRGSGVWTAHAGVVVVLSQNPEDPNDYSAMFKNNFMKAPPRQFHRQQDGTFEATAWNHTITDEDIRAFVEGLRAPMNESEVAALIAKGHGMSDGSVRNRLMDLRGHGRLDGLWDRHGQKVVYHGPEVSPS